MPEKDEIIIKCCDYLKTKTSSRFVFSGSFGLYIQGISLNQDFHDIDIMFLDLNDDEVKKLELCFEPKIHKLMRGNEKRSGDFYKEVDFHGEKVFVFPPQIIVDIKKRDIDFIENRAKIKTNTRVYSLEKNKKDLEYIREKFGIK